jgi:hypothetical protein
LSYKEGTGVNCIVKYAGARIWLGAERLFGLRGFWQKKRGNRKLAIRFKDGTRLQPVSGLEANACATGGTGNLFIFC